MYQAQQEIKAREEAIAEAAAPGTINSSGGMVMGVVNMWEELRKKETALKPVLLVGDWYVWWYSILCLSPPPSLTCSFTPSLSSSLPPSPHPSPSPHPTLPCQVV